MAKNTSILLGDHFDKFIGKQVESGRFSSTSEVIRAALRLFEQEERKKRALAGELRKGESSGLVENWNPGKFMKSLHKKHGTREI